MQTTSTDQRATDNSSNQDKKKKRKDKDKKGKKGGGGGVVDQHAGGQAEGGGLPPPPPAMSPEHVSGKPSPAFFPSNAPLEGAERGDAAAWHLCRDEHGNAYYYNENSGRWVSVCSRRGGAAGYRHVARTFRAQAAVPTVIRLLPCLTFWVAHEEVGPACLLPGGRLIFVLLLEEKSYAERILTFFFYILWSCLGCSIIIVVVSMRCLYW